MSDQSSFRRLFRLAATRRTVAHEVDDEVRFHLDQRVDDLVARGYAPSAAREIALREFGDPAAARAELTAMDRRRVRRGALREWVSSLGQDLRFAIRALRTRPAFTATVLVTLALGIGANAAIFSVVDSVLIRSLPYSQPDRLVHLWETYQSNVDNRSEASYPDYLDWRVRNRAFADLGGYHGSGFVFGSDHPAVISAAKSTANFFDVLGVHAALGRTFAAGEDAPGAPRVALLSYEFWQSAFGGQASAIGRTITLDGASARVIGVLPQAFQFARVGNASLWTPLDRSAQARTYRGNHWLNVVGRLKPGVTPGAASKDMSSIMAQLAREYPSDDNGRDAQVVPLRDQLLGSIRPLLLLLYGAVAVMLLVACANVANLLLMRGAGRRRELALRVALGAGRGRLVRQLMTESLVLAVAGGALGLIVARGGVRAILRVIPAASRGPMLSGVGVNTTVVVYSIIISVLAGVLFGFLPALRGSRDDLADALKEGTRGSGRAGTLRDALVVAEVALTIVLMAGAALFGRSLIKLMSIQLGFVPEHVTTAGIFLPNAGYADPTLRVATFDRIVERVCAIPGVSDAGLVTKLPLEWGNSTGFRIVGQPVPEPDKEPTASYRTASPGYFSALRIPVLRGRAFDAGDDPKAPTIGIVNRTFADAYFHGGSAVGQVLIFNEHDSLRVVGEVGDVPIGNVDERIPPTLYVPFAQDPDTFLRLAIRSPRPADALARELTSIVEQTAHGAGVVNIVSMDQLLTTSASVSNRRFPLFLIGVFAVMTLVLALVGIYGVVSYSVAQRTREIGIRVALGAQRGGVVLLVMRHGLGLAVLGVAAGVTASMLLGRVVQGMLYGIGAHDPVTLSLVSVVLAAAAACATIAPARRATRIDPAIAFRAE